VYSNPGDVDAGLKIHFGDITLDELVKSQLDERGLITIGATMTSGQDIGMELTTLTHTKGYDFIYDIVFNLYLHDVTLPYPDNMLSSPIIDSISHSSIALATISFPLGIHYFTGLSPGQFYTVFGTLTNTRTGTAVENIEVTGGQNIATIKNIYDISVTVINEATIGIQFKGHDTVVASWSASGKRIKFSVSVNGYSGEINSGLTQDLSQISFDTSLKTFNLSVSSIVGYGNGGILRVSSFQTNAKTINIISNHVEGGTFEMSQSVQMTLFTFVAPRHPPSLSINYVDKRLTWNHTNNPVDRLKTIYFELYKGSTKEYDGINKLFGIGPSSVGSWTVKAKNVYGQLSGVSNSLDIITPSFDVGSITSIGNKTFNIGISNVNTNGTYTLSGTNINTSSSSSIITSILIPGTYTFRVNLTDQLGLVASRNTSSLTINTPSVVFDPPSFRYSGTQLRYYVIVSVSNPNGSWGIDGIPTSVGGTYRYNGVSVNNVYFDFLSNDLGGNKITSVTIKDSYGYTSSTINNINLTVTFTFLSTTISVISSTIISFNSGLSNVSSHQWYKDSSIISYDANLTLTSSNSGRLYCTAIQTNAEGFIQTITSDTIVNPSFNINSSITAIGDKTFTISIDTITFNRAYTLEDGASSGKLIATSSSSTPSSSMTTNELLTGIHDLSIKLTDELGLSVTKNISYTINSPAVFFSNPLSFIHSSGTPLKYYLIINVSNPNRYWGIDGTPSSTKGTYQSTSGNNVYFMFSSTDYSGRIEVSVTIKDAYGYTATTIQPINLPVTFESVSTAISVISSTIISFHSGTLSSHQWYKDGSIISYGANLTLTSSNSGTLHCTAIQTNAEGFIQTITSDTIVNPSFNIISPITAIGNMTFTISIDNITFNGSYTLEDGASSGKLIATSSSSTISSSMTTNELSTGTHDLSIKLIDELGLSVTKIISHTILSPVVNIVSDFIYSGNQLEYNVMIYIRYTNGTWGIDGTPSSEGGTYKRISGNNITFAFSEYDGGGNKLTNVTIKDAYGYSATKTQTKNLPITFDHVSLSIGVQPAGHIIASSPAYFLFRSGLESYQWYIVDIDDTPISPNGDGLGLAITSSNYGQLYCIAIQRNDQGFRRTITSETKDNIEPSLYNSNFTSFNFDNLPISTVFTYNYGPDTRFKMVSHSEFDIEVHYSGSKINTYRGDGIYTLFGTFLNQYDVEKQIEIGALYFTGTPPSKPTGVFASDIEDFPPSILINWTSLGDDGSPSENPSTIRLYSHTSYFDPESIGDINYETINAGSSRKFSSFPSDSRMFYYAIIKDYPTYGIVSTRVYEEVIRY
jgi:hypothetical protein